MKMPLIGWVWLSKRVLGDKRLCRPGGLALRSKPRQQRRFTDRGGDPFGQKRTLTIKLMNR